MWSDMLMAISILALFPLGMAMGWYTARAFIETPAPPTPPTPTEKPSPERLWGWHDYYRHEHHHHTDTTPWQKHN